MATVGANSATLFCTNPEKKVVLWPQGIIPFNGLYREAPPEKGIFFRLQVYERAGISLVEVYERVEITVISACKKAKSRGIKLAHGPSFILLRFFFFSAGNAEKNNNRNVVEGSKTWTRQMERTVGEELSGLWTPPSRWKYGEYIAARKNTTN